MPRTGCLTTWVVGIGCCVGKRRERRESTNRVSFWESVGRIEPRAAMRVREYPVKRTRAHGGCLGTDRRRRARQAAKSLGEPHVGVDPGVPEWGNPARVVYRHRWLNP